MRATYAQIDLSAIAHNVSLVKAKRRASGDDGGR